MQQLERGALAEPGRLDRRLKLGVGAKQEGPGKRRVIALVARRERDGHQVLCGDGAKRRAGEDRRRVGDPGGHHRVDAEPLRARLAHHRLRRGGDVALADAGAQRSRGGLEPEPRDPVGLIDHGLLGIGLGRAHAVGDLVGRHELGAAGRERLERLPPQAVGDRAGAEQRDPPRAGERGRKPCGAALDRDRRVLLVGVSELLDRHDLVNRCTRRDDLGVADRLGAAQQQRTLIAGARAQQHRLEVGLEIGEVADVVGAGDGAVIAVGDPGIEPGPGERVTDRPRARNKFAIGDPRAGV